jgi:hypothetical protein
MALGSFPVWRGVVSGCALLLVAACATPAEVGMMIPSPPATEVPQPIVHAIEVGLVSGGQPTNPLWASQVGNEDFRAALVQALEQAQLDSLVGASPRYRLDADLVGLEQPVLGFDLTVTATVNYELTPLAGGEPYRTTIARPYTASMGDSLYAPARLRKANEGAIRENIGAYISELSLHYANASNTGV